MTKEVVGVAFAIGPGLPPALKQQLLLVDRVGAVELDKIDVSMDGLTRTWPHEPADIVALRDQGVLFHIDNSLPADLLSHDEAGPALQAALEATRKSQEFSQQIPRNVSWDEAPAAFDLLHASTDQMMVSRSHLARAIAVHLRQTKDLDSVSLLPIIESGTTATSRDAVFRIVLAELPLPSETVPFHEVVEFRRTSDIRERLHGIRVWANRIARERVSRLRSKRSSHISARSMKIASANCKRTPRLEFSRYWSPRFSKSLSMWEISISAAQRGLSSQSVVSGQICLRKNVRYLAAKSVMS
jgi:hypothetical protein